MLFALDSRGYFDGLSAIKSVGVQAGKKRPVFREPVYPRTQIPNGRDLRWPGTDAKKGDSLSVKLREQLAL